MEAELHDSGSLLSGNIPTTESLLAMIKFYAAHFYKISQIITASMALLANERFTDGGATKELYENLGTLERLCVQIDLRSPIRHIGRIRKSLDMKIESSVLAHYLNELQNRVADELEVQSVFLIPYRKKQYLESLSPLFGSEVPRAFPSSITDIEEAAKCYALDRNTACVFHLMRVMEIGLRALGKTLGDSSLDHRTNPTWEKILRRCDQELRLPVASRSPAWMANNEFFAEATANLRAVKDAWRNKTVHVEASYDESRALSVFNAVRSFMQHLATTIEE